MRTVLIIEANPNPASFGAALSEAYARGLKRAGAQVHRLTLADLEFNPILTGFSADQALEPDLIDARRKIEHADHVTVQFPVWWGSAPALLKGFIDRVFLPGWAFEFVPGASLPKGKLAGRSARLLATMDSPWWWYWWKHGRSAHRALTHATLHYVGISPVRETTIYQLRSLSEQQRADWLSTAEKLGEADGRG